MAKTLKDISAEIASDLGVTKASAESVLKLAFEKIDSLVKAGEEIRIHNFGTFSRQDRLARTGRNPATGESIQIPASSRLHFKPTKRSK
jgi:nucleoid DNA-binding protein